MMARSPARWWRITEVRGACPVRTRNPPGKRPGRVCARRGPLPYLSGRLGHLTRTDSEALVGAQTDNRRYRRVTGVPRADFTRGVAITSSIPVSRAVRPR
ncbi:hypothetical protein [Streptomyces sp. NPDC018347]|uniref:hypothetical protein n=1 Tax=Streptomyces sp. NPDC018347 TaxID=3157193 RepID=UPI0033E5D8E6